ncbi:MAG: twin-arginine translocation pathway signal protein [Deltaproteobacteria bacterium]|nr:twin-arginine translocation pathway signal protein [Deltaproteobacteria bacterium]
MQEPISFPRRHFLAAGLGALLLAAGRGLAGACAPTDENPQGPFYLPDMPLRPDLAPRDEPGERLAVTGRVLSAADCRPLAGAVVEVWHASAAGIYYGMEGVGGEDASRLRGRIRSGTDGGYRFVTILPGRYSLSPRRFRPRHIHYLVSHAGHRTLVTQLYFAGDPDLAGDPFVRPSLVVPLRKVGADAKRGRLLAASFDLVLAPT